MSSRTTLITLLITLGFYVLWLGATWMTEMSRRPVSESPVIDQSNQVQVTEIGTIERDGVGNDVTIYETVYKESKLIRTKCIVFVYNGYNLVAECNR